MTLKEALLEKIGAEATILVTDEFGNEIDNLSLLGNLYNHKVSCIREDFKGFYVVEVVTIIPSKHDNHVGNYGISYQYNARYSSYQEVESINGTWMEVQARIKELRDDCCYNIDVEFISE